MPARSEAGSCSHARKELACCPVQTAAAASCCSVLTGAAAKLNWTSAVLSLVSAALIGSPAMLMLASVVLGLALAVLACSRAALLEWVFAALTLSPGGLHLVSARLEWAGGMLAWVPRVLAWPALRVRVCPWVIWATGHLTGLPLPQPDASVRQTEPYTELCWASVCVDQAWLLLGAARLHLVYAGVTEAAAGQIQACQVQTGAFAGLKQAGSGLTETLGMQSAAYACLPAYAVKLQQAFVLLMLVHQQQLVQGAAVQGAEEQLQTEAAAFDPCVAEHAAVECLVVQFVVLAFCWAAPLHLCCCCQQHAGGMLGAALLQVWQPKPCLRP